MSHHAQGQRVKPTGHDYANRTCVRCGDDLTAAEAEMGDDCRGCLHDDDLERRRES